MEVTLRELLSDEEFIAKLYGWSYNRNFDRIAAEELSQEIILQLLIASQTVKYDYTYAYIWKIAENTYNRTTRQTIKHGNHAEYDNYVNVNTDTDMENDIITAIVDRADYDAIRAQISFMSKIYRDVMVMFYFDGLQMTDIAEKLNIPLNRVKQRLHTAKEKIRKEVTNMSNNNIALKPIKIFLPGSGNPLKSSARDQMQSVIAQNIAYSCRNKAKTPSEIASELSVPTVFIEDMLGCILGEVVKDCGDGKYIANSIIIDDADVKIITDAVKVIVKDYVADVVTYLYSKKDEIMNLKYYNTPKSFEFILWSIIPRLEADIQWKLQDIVDSHYTIENEKRDFKVLGIAYQDEPTPFNMYSQNGIIDDSVWLCNFIGSRLSWDKSRFGCEEPTPEHITFTFKCCGGYSKSDVKDDETATCAKALEIGYISLADDGKYYPEVIIWDKEWPNLDISAIADKHAKQIGEKFVGFADKYIPAHLINQRDIFCNIMTGPLRGQIIEEAISQGALYVPEGDTIIEGIFGIKK